MTFKTCCQLQSVSQSHLYTITVAVLKSREQHCSCHCETLRAYPKVWHSTSVPISKKRKKEETIPSPVPKAESQTVYENRSAIQTMLHASSKAHLSLLVVYLPYGCIQTERNVSKHLKNTVRSVIIVVEKDHTHNCTVIFFMKSGGWSWKKNNWVGMYVFHPPLSATNGSCCQLMVPVIKKRRLMYFSADKCCQIMTVCCLVRKSVLSVSIQCLETVYGLTTSDQNQVAQYRIQRNLLDIFNSQLSEVNHQFCCLLHVSVD